MDKPWLKYEKAARAVLEQIGEHLGLASVEGKQELPGASGTIWDVDAKALREGSKNFLVVEVRRRGKPLAQSDIAAIAFEIEDVGATGGIVVTPVPLQRGANIVARATGIEHVRLGADATSTDYLAEYMGRHFIGASVSEVAVPSDVCDAVLVKGDTNDA